MKASTSRVAASPELPQHVAAQIAAHRARLAELRSQRPFRRIATRNVIDLSAHRMARFPLVGVTR